MVARRDRAIFDEHGELSAAHIGFNERLPGGLELLADYSGFRSALMPRDGGRRRDAAVSVMNSTGSNSVSCSRRGASSTRLSRRVPLLTCRTDAHRRMGP